MTKETNKKLGTDFENKVKLWFEAHLELPFDKKKIKIGKPPEKNMNLTL